MPFPLSAPTYSNEKEKDNSTQLATKNAATTVATFIINCLSENSNDLSASRSDGICRCAISITNSSPPRYNLAATNAAANESSTPAK